MRNVMFGAVGTLENKFVNFSLLTRFLILSHVTGSVHIFRVHFSPENVQQPFYPRIPAGLLSETPLCAGEREDTVGYIRGYIYHCYAACQRERPPTSTLENDLALMQLFWNEFFHAQDSTLICLELEQRFLFFHQLKSLHHDLQRCQNYIGKQVLHMFTNGLVFQPGDNHHIRLNFIDVMTRRWLLRGYTALKIYENG